MEKPEDRGQIDPEVERILKEREASFAEDKKKAESRKDALLDIRTSIKQSVPR